MPTAPLSLFAHVFRSYAPLRHLIPREVHPSSPALLTSAGPLERPLARAGPGPALWRIRSLTVVPRQCPALARLYSTAPYTTHSAVLRDISGGTSYQMVRLVFRPYTQVARSI